MKGNDRVCARCGRIIARGQRVFYLRGVPLGSKCCSVIRHRENIRSGGFNSRVVKDLETGFFHTVSDFGVFCPKEGIHCLGCSFLRDEFCPAEISFGDFFREEGVTG